MQYGMKTSILQMFYTHIFPVTSIMLFTNEFYFISKNKAGFRCSNTWFSDQSTFLLSNTAVRE